MRSVVRRRRRPRTRWWAWALGTVVAGCAGDDGAPRLGLAVAGDSSHIATVRWIGVSAADLAALTRPGGGVFVYLAGEDRRRTARSPVAGGVRVTGSAVEFTPDHPFVAGQRYRVLLHGATTHEAEFVVPRTPARVPHVDGVFPSGDTVPENLLRVHVRFSVPMRAGVADSLVRLRDDRGRTVEAAFFHPDGELWDADGRELTLLLHPARVKSGVGANARLGRALRSGQRFSLVVTPGWPSADGEALPDSVIKTWSVVGEQTRRLDERRWHVSPPRAGTRAPLRVDFDVAMSRPWLERHASVVDAAGRRLEGRVRIGHGERTWQFTPADPWIAGAYAISVDARLEDVAGNNLQEPFEREAGSAQRTVRRVLLRFTVS